LQLANSAFFGRKQVMTCPSEATLYLGLETVSALALHLHLFESLEKTPTVTTTFLSDLQTRSAHVANIAHHIALQISKSEEVAKEAFAGGLLSDIGKLVLSLTPELAAGVS
jgi:HD-like signal output (HDOD) protein